MTAAARSPEERVLALAAIASQRLDFLETLQLDRALRQAGPALPDGFTRTRLALIGSANLDHLAPAIRVAGLRHKLLLEVHTGAYGQYRQDVLDPGSALHQFAPQAVLLSMVAKQVMGALPVSASAHQVDAAVMQVVNETRALWHRLRATQGATVVQQTFLDTASPLFGSHDRLVPASPSSLVARLNEALAAAAAEDGVLLLDVARRSQLDGLDAWYDVIRWLQAKQEIAPQAAPFFGDLLVRILAAQRGLSRKCLVLDLDNTLWGGVIGDDGLEGIVLGEGSAAGEAHVALQHYVLALRERGILLAVCSKNDAATAEGVFRHHPGMALRRADFAAFVANWEDKAANLRTIAQQLNIGLDSLVFVDDSPVERARVREALPMVAVPEMPDDPAHYVRVLADAGYFEAVSLTPDDLQRAGQYAANAEREALRDGASGVEDFLRGLGMSVVYSAFEARDLPRVAQLINKTNQFNTTTKRYSLDEVAAIAAVPENITLQFRLLDRLGDNGLVSTMIIRPAEDAPAVFEIDNWVMSCRVFGRKLEYEAMNIAVDAVRRRNARALRANYVPTAKNSVIRELYPQLGFTAVAKADGAGTTRWLLDLAKYHRRHTQIARTPAP
jgi:FkbH-like protein